MAVWLGWGGVHLCVWDAVVDWAGVHCRALDAWRGSGNQGFVLGAGSGTLLCRGGRAGVQWDWGASRPHPLYREPVTTCAWFITAMEGERRGQDRGSAR